MASTRSCFLAGADAPGQDGLRGHEPDEDPCANRGIGVAAMKTYAGGAVFEKKLPLTPLQCIAYTLAQPAVATVAVGFKTVEQVGAAMRYLTATPAEKAVESAVPLVQEHLRGTCIYCGHCLPCPSVVDIPRINGLVAAAESGVSENLRKAYDSTPVRASACVECGLCAERCPFGVDVVANMLKAQRLFEQG